MTRSIPALRAAASAALFTLFGCQDSGGVACTAQFVAYALVITDNAGAPAGGVDLTVTLVRSGERLEPAPVGPHPDGTYPLLDDGATNKLRVTGDQVRAVGTKGPATVQADFLFDVPGGCHVHKVSGPPFHEAGYRAKGSRLTRACGY